MQRGTTRSYAQSYAQNRPLKAVHSGMRDFGNGIKIFQIVLGCDRIWQKHPAQQKVADLHFVILNLAFDCICRS